ncbi:MAG: bifunctional hydroxymethylpyrimidine kinase/phosphomethylpyrimidine kinase [bacterium]
MKQKNILPVVLTIAGSDSGGGAGIQADLKTFTALGVYGSSVITAVTAQNTLKVSSVYPLPAKIVHEQLDTVISDIKPDFIKIGMLSNSETIETVTNIIKKYKFKNVILDPVMVSKSGNRLMEKAAINVLKEKLIPQAFLITPNTAEAEILTGIKINNFELIIKASEKLVKTGAKNVLIKGGHLRNNTCRDFLLTGNKYIVFSRKRIKTKNTHGTGCTYSSAIAAYLAKGEKLETAVQKARDYLHMAIKNSMQLGKGRGPVNHFVLMQRQEEVLLMREELKAAVKKINTAQTAGLIPEVQSNLAYAFKNADNLNEVLGFPGRIIRFKDELKILAPPEPGASKHTGKVVLTAMKHNPSFRAAMNVKFSDKIINICKKLKFKTAEFNRRKEPPETKFKDGCTIEWGTDFAIKKIKNIPDIIFDRGADGKEPMIRVLGRNPDDVANKIIKITKYIDAGA